MSKKKTLPKTLKQKAVSLFKNEKEEYAYYLKEYKGRIILEIDADDKELLFSKKIIENVFQRIGSNKDTVYLYLFFIREYFPHHLRFAPVPELWTMLTVRHIGRVFPSHIHPGPPQNNKAFCTISRSRNRSATTSS